MAEELENSVNYKGNPEEDRRECIVPETMAGQRLDHALSELYPEFSRSRLQAWIKSGKAQVDGDLKDPSDKVWGGEKIVLWPEPEPGTTPDQPEAIPLTVVFEDAGIVVIDKPAGMVVHPGNGNPTGTLLNALLHHCPQVSDLPRAGIVHRLDKETSGLLVVAKTLKAHADLVRQLQARTVKRDYFALVQGEIDRSGTVDMPLARDPLNRTRRAVHPMGKPAVPIRFACTWHIFVIPWLVTRSMVRCVVGAACGLHGMPCMPIAWVWCIRTRARKWNGSHRYHPI